MGKRMGLPKALIKLPNGRSMLTNAMQILREGGCQDVVLVVGAGESYVRKALEAARPEVSKIIGDGRLFIVSNPDFEEGMSSSVRAGMRALGQLDSKPDAAVIQLVDTPDISPDAIDKVARFSAPDALVVATYDGKIGHPTLIGRAHWEPIASSVKGDVGARQYFKGRSDLKRVPCDGLGSPADLDTPEQLAARRRKYIPADIVRAEVTNDVVSVSYLEILVQDRRSGAVVSFSGTVRDHDEGRTVTRLNYLTHPTADETIKKIAQEVAATAGVRALAVQHRVGPLEIGEVALACVVSADHRKEAFDACSLIVERVKSELPIWKRQLFEDGTDEWVNAP